MQAQMQLIEEHSVNFQNCAFVVSTLDNIAHGQRPGIIRIFEIPRVNRVFTDFVESAPRSPPLFERPRALRRIGTRDIFVLVVFLCALNNAVVSYVFNRLQQLGLTHRHTDGQTETIVQLWGLVARQSSRDNRKHEAQSKESTSAERRSGFWQASPGQETTHDHTNEKSTMPIFNHCT